MTRFVQQIYNMNNNTSNVMHPTHKIRIYYFTKKKCSIKYTDEEKQMEYYQVLIWLQQKLADIFEVKMY